MNFSLILGKTTKTRSNNDQQQQPSDHNSSMVINPGLVTFVQMDPQQRHQQQPNQLLLIDNQNNQNPASRFPYNIQQRRLLPLGGSILMPSSSSSSSSSSILGSSNQQQDDLPEIQSETITNSQQQSSSTFANQMIQQRFNQRQLTKGAMMIGSLMVNNNNKNPMTTSNPNLILRPPPGFGPPSRPITTQQQTNNGSSFIISNNPAQTSHPYHSNQHWKTSGHQDTQPQPQQQQQHHPMCEKNPESNWNRILSSLVVQYTQSQQAHQHHSQLPMIHRYPSTAVTNSSLSSNQPVIYDFVNPNFNPPNPSSSPCGPTNHQWPLTIGRPLMVSRTNQTTRPHGQSFCQQSYYIQPQQQQRWTILHQDLRSCNHQAIAQTQCSSTYMVNETERNTEINTQQSSANLLNPNAMDFFPTTAQKQMDTLEISNKPSVMVSNYQTTSSDRFISEPKILKDDNLKKWKQSIVGNTISSPVEKARRQVSFIHNDFHQLPQLEFLNDYVSKLIDEEDMNPDDPDLDVLCNSNSFEDIFDPPSIKESCQQIISNDENEQVEIYEDEHQDSDEHNEQPSDSKPVISLSEDEDQQTSPSKEKPQRNRCVSLSSGVTTNGSIKIVSNNLPLCSHQRRSSISSNDSSYSLSMPSGNRNRAYTTSSFISDSIIKRFIKLDRYKTELCIYKQEVGKCPYGDQCCFAHGPEEMRPRAPHDCKERTQPCEAYSNGVCYRGSSRCWYLHEKPEFNLERLRSDLRHWLLHKPFQPKLLTDAGWFDPNWNPKFYDQLRYRSRMDVWLQDRRRRLNDAAALIPPDPDVNFAGDHNLNEHFRFHQRYCPIFEEIFRALSVLKKKSDEPASTTNHGLAEKIFSKVDAKKSQMNLLTPKYQYNWSRAGVQASDDLIRLSFYSVPNINFEKAGDKSNFGHSAPSIGVLLDEIFQLKDEK